MPRLKKLELQGFKSFADPSDFLFPTGITAVVGPNGSGKSNVADSIRWVLGEQRMTAIRGRTGEDMIFAGSPKRARSGMARAAITFDNSDGWLPVEFAEVTVERRTYRDGTSDYILNGSKVRLMDLRDLLDRGGLGRDAYLIIGQGLVDQVLSLRPQERLALFEQAAGITPYRTRREDAVARLGQTKQNLQRVYDIVGEIEPRLRRLQRQAERAEEHGRLQQDLNATLQIWYGYRWGRGIATLEQVRQRVSYREDKALALLEQSEILSQSVMDQRRLINRERERLADLHRASSDEHNEAGRRQRELAVARERQRQLHERREESEANLVPLRSALTSEQEDVTSLQSDVRATEERLTAARGRLDEAQAAHDVIAKQRNTLLRRQAQAQAEALETRHRLSDRTSRLEQARERRQELAEQAKELDAALAAATERRRAQQREVAAARDAFEEASTAFEAAQAEASELEASLESARQDVEALRGDMGRQQAELQRSTARLEALDRLHQEGTGLYAGVRAVLGAAQAGELQGLPGTIASLVQVPAELERAMEAALGSQLQNVVAGTWRDAQTAITWLKERRAGRATFLPLDTLRPPSPLDLPQASGVIGVASELVRYDAVYRPAVLLLLGRTAVAEQLDAARRLFDRLHGGFRIVTLDGEIVRSGGSVTGGDRHSSQGAGLLARERERRELRQETAGLRREVRRLRERLAEAEGRVSDLTAQRQAAQTRRRDAEALARSRERALDTRVRDLERLLQEIAWQTSRQEEVVQEQARTGEAIQRLEQACASAEQGLAEVEVVLDEITKALAGLADDETAQVVAERRTELAVLEQERESRQVLLESRQREITRLERQIANQEHRIRSLEGELAALSDTLMVLGADYEEARARADKIAAQIPPLEARLAEMEAELTALESKEQSSRKALRDAEHRLNQAEVDASRREDQVQALRREIEETLGIVVGNLPDSISAQQPLPLDAIVAPLPTVKELPEGLESQIRDLRTQLRRLEPVNPAAQEEYAELSERHGFLREQMDDLERASSHLHQIIEELDEMMDTMFSTTFKSIASGFSKTFELLFNGGIARLNLVEDEGDRVGVEIMARPPGKRTSGLSMLSGGERSLTAVALLFSVMQVSPTPFCVLDEVDAMLDEANVGRFRRLLRELARETQFIIITHNRGTVEVADTIYGVSMGDDGVSQVLSLSLEDLPASEVM